MELLANFCFLRQETKQSSQAKSGERHAAGPDTGPVQDAQHGGKGN